MEAAAREIARIDAIWTEEAIAEIVAIMERHGLREPAECICIDGCDIACAIHGGVM